MKVEIKERIENSVLLIMDARAGVPPESMGGNSVASNSSCIAVGTLMEMDGDTHIVLADEIWPDMHSELREIFRGSLSTPRKELSVCSIRSRPLLTLTVPTAQTVVKVYANDDSEPSEILVQIASS